MGAKKDRYDDISHSRHAVGFLAMLHAQAQSAYGISEDLVERVLRTFLESNRGAPAEQPAPVLRRPTRFACDIIGTTDVDEKEMGRLLPGACFQTLRRSHASSKKGAGLRRKGLLLPHNGHTLRRP